MTTTTTAILLGSARRPGNTHQLADMVATQLEARVFSLSDYTIGHFDYDFCNRDDDFLTLVEQLLSFDRLIFATPVYWYAPSGLMKVFMDRLSDLLKTEKEMGRQLRNKSAAVLATGSDTVPVDCFEQVFVHTFDYLGMAYRGMLYCACQEDFEADEHAARISAFVGAQ